MLEQAARSDIRGIVEEAENRRRERMELAGVVKVERRSVVSVRVL